MTQRALVVSLILLVFSLPLVVLASSPPEQTSGDSNLLQNPGFEEGINFWRPGHSTTQFDTDTEFVNSGQRAASLNKFDGAPCEISIEQDVEGIIGGMPYALSGWAYENSPNFNWVMLRIEWWSSSKNLSKTDSQWLSDEASYQLLSIDSAVAPSDATRARIKCIGYIQEPVPDSTAVFFDDLSFTFQGSQMYLPLVVKKH